MYCRRLKSIVMALLLAVPASLVGQDRPKPVRDAAPKPESLLKIQGDISPGRAQTYEDIEIMKRILLRSLHVREESLAVVPITRDQMQGGYMYWDTTRKTSSSVKVDGVYLQGYGIVFNIGVPTSGVVLPEPPKQNPDAITDWNRARKELAGEKITKAEDRPRQRLDDLLAKLLMDNGRHFSNLGEKENITLVVSFEAPTQLQAGGGGRTSGGLGGSGGGIGGGGGTARYGIGVLPSHSATPGQGPSNNLFEPNPATSSSTISDGEGDQELLADLQLKQGRIEEALRIYSKALAEQTDPRRKASLYRKLAEAELKRSEKGGDTIARAIDLLKKAQENAAKSADTRKAAKTEDLSSKWIITAPKSLLDAAAKGMNFEDFRRDVRIEKIKFFLDNTRPQRVSTRDARIGITVDLENGTVTANDEKLSLISRNRI